MVRRVWTVLGLAAAIAVAGCSQPAPPAASSPSASSPSTVVATKPAQPAPPEKLAVEHLPNAYRIHERVISGGLPDGAAGFAELEALGVKTVISVDGAKPDVALARQHGLRYVHLPHGYDGIPDSRAKELAKAVRDLEGLVYIHCHHGKHRSPAAAAVACVSAGLVSSEGARGILTAAGTSDHYRGLYQAAESARRFEDKLLDELQAEFPETAPLAPMAEAMVALEHTHDHLKSFAAGNWQRLPKQPDLDPAHEALLLREHFTELLRTEDARQQPERFQQLLIESETATMDLEAALRDRTAAGDDQTFITAANTAFTRVSNHCTTCHRAYRDVPLGEKAK